MREMFVAWRGGRGAGERFEDAVMVGEVKIDDVGSSRGISEAKMSIGEVSPVVAGMVARRLNLRTMDCQCVYEKDQQKGGGKKRTEP